jgi:hypothetical protein
MVYAVVKIYDPGAGEYSEEVLSLHYNRNLAEDKATSFIIKAEEDHLARQARLLKAGYSPSGYPENTEFYGNGGGRWGSTCWKVIDMEIEE